MLYSLIVSIVWSFLNLFSFFWIPDQTSSDLLQYRNLYEYHKKWYRHDIHQQHSAVWTGERNEKIQESQSSNW